MNSSDRKPSILALLMSPYSGNGGIAQYLRSVLEIVSKDAEVSYLSRYDSSDTGSKKLSRASFILSVLSQLLKKRDYDLVLCGHLYLLPIALFVRMITGAKIIVFIYGIESWEPLKRPFTARLLGYADGYIACSQYTLTRFLEWADLESSTYTAVLHGMVDRDRFQPGDKDRVLQEKLHLSDKKVLFTLARLNPDERYKGIDETLNILPEILNDDPNIIYIIGGDGEDRARLEEKVGSLGLLNNVIFLGYIEESYKADYFRLADLFVMPGRGEGFGLVYLEALACGIPVLGSLLDASKETLLDGELGCLVDPRDPESLRDGIRKGIAEGNVNSQLLDRYSESHFKAKLRQILDQILP